MQRRPVVTVVGSFAVGITLRVPRFPVQGETLIGRDFDMGPGGKGSNQAVGAARLGAESHLLAAIGCDAFGEIGLDLWRREEVDRDYIAQLADSHTGVGLITLDEAGNNHIVIDLGANNLLTPADVDRAEALIARSDVITTVLEIPLETAARAMEIARRNGVTAILNPAPAQHLPDSVLAYADILTPNESELRVLCGLAPDDPTETLTLAKHLKERGVQNLVITRGARGALILDTLGRVTEVPSIPTQVVDTTGGGDAFNSALAVALAEDRPLEEAVHWAIRAGAHACTRLGVIPALPTWQDLDTGTFS